MLVLMVAITAAGARPGGRFLSSKHSVFTSFLAGIFAEEPACSL